LESDGRILQPSSSDGPASFFDGRRTHREDEGELPPADHGVAVGVAVVRRLAVQRNQSRKRCKFDRRCHAGLLDGSFADWPFHQLVVS
jgi:hypothetical protein